MYLLGVHMILMFIKISLRAGFVKTYENIPSAGNCLLVRKDFIHPTFSTILFKNTIIKTNTGSREILFSSKHNQRFNLFDACNFLIYQIANGNHIACYHMRFQHAKSSSFANLLPPFQKVNGPPFAAPVFELMPPFQILMPGGSKLAKVQ